MSESSSKWIKGACIAVIVTCVIVSISALQVAFVLTPDSGESVAQQAATAVPTQSAATSTSNAESAVVFLGHDELVDCPELQRLIEQFPEIKIKKVKRVDSKIEIVAQTDQEANIRAFMHALQEDVDQVIPNYIRIDEDRVYEFRLSYTKS